jgi:hypothetical protein
VGKTRLPARDGQPGGSLRLKVLVTQAFTLNIFPDPQADASLQAEEQLMSS